MNSLSQFAMMNTPLPTEINRGLLCLLILYVRNQEALYIDYHAGFITLAEWLYIDPLDEGHFMYKAGGYPNYPAPDICSHCLVTMPTIVGGRVREGCPSCQGNKQWRDRVLHTIWQYRFCEILRVTDAWFEFHLAYALEFIKAGQQQELHHGTI